MTWARRMNASRLVYIVVLSRTKSSSSALAFSRRRPTHLSTGRPIAISSTATVISKDKHKPSDIMLQKLDLRCGPTVAVAAPSARKYAGKPTGFWSICPFIRASASSPWNRLRWRTKESLATAPAAYWRRPGQCINASSGDSWSIWYYHE